MIVIIVKNVVVNAFYYLQLTKSSRKKINKRKYSAYSNR